MKSEKAGNASEGEGTSVGLDVKAHGKVWRRKLGKKTDWKNMLRRKKKENYLRQEKGRVKQKKSVSASWRTF